MRGIAIDFLPVFCYIEIVEYQLANSLSCVFQLLTQWLCVQTREVWIWRPNMVAGLVYKSGCQGAKSETGPFAVGFLFSNGWIGVWG